jgi:hypothetical protein
VVSPKFQELAEKNVSQDTEIDALKERSRVSEERVANNDALLNELREKVGLMSIPTVTPAARDFEEYNRRPFLHLLAISTEGGQTVSKVDALAGLQDMLTGAGITCASSLDGPALGSQFTLRLECNDLLAATDLKKAKLSLRLATGGWKRLSCPSASKPDEKITLFANFDEGPRARRENGGGRALGRIIRKLLPDSRIMVRGNTTYLDNEALVRVSAPTQGEPPKLQTFPANCIKAKLDTAIVKREFELGAPSPVAEEEWQCL